MKLSSNHKSGGWKTGWVYRLEIKLSSNPMQLECNMGLIDMLTAGLSMKKKLVLDTISLSGKLSCSVLLL